MGPLLQEKGALEHLICISITVSLHGLGKFSWAAVLFLPSDLEHMVI